VFLAATSLADYLPQMLTGLKDVHDTPSPDAPPVPQIPAAA
jgi:hypothetical protein